MTMHELGVKYGTNKTNIKPSPLSIIPQYIDHRRHDKINILELGVAGPRKTCPSLRVWREYFPNSNIFGVDIVDVRHLEDDINATIEHGSQTDPKILQKLGEKAGGFDLVVDDGSHINSDIISSFLYLEQYLNPNCVYIIEDTQNSYHPKIVRNNLAAMAKVPHNDRKELDVFISKIIIDIDKSSYNSHWAWPAHKSPYLSVQIWPGVIVILRSSSPNQGMPILMI